MDEYEDTLYMDRFYDPYGTSALHAGARIYPCPTCDEPNRLTSRDVESCYQCDECANALERGW